MRIKVKENNNNLNERVPIQSALETRTMGLRNRRLRCRAKRRCDKLADRRGTRIHEVFKSSN